MRFSTAATSSGGARVSFGFVSSVERAFRGPGGRRISGSLASLAGLEAGDPQSVARILLAHAVVLGFGGLPVIWMGDELGLLNDPDWADDPAHAGDNRWVHRPRMPWDLAARRHQAGTLEHRIYSGIRHLVRVRSALPALEASVETQVLDPVNPAVLVCLRYAPTQTMVAVHNVTPETQSLPRWVVPVGNWAWDALTEDTPLTDGPLSLEPYEVRWFVQQT